MRRWSAFSLGLFAACHKPAPDAAAIPVVKIVSSLPRTGSGNQQTTPMVNAIRLAIDEAQGRAGPFRVVYEDWDDASARKGDWDPEVEASNAERAIGDDDVMAYLGPYNSGAAKISMPLLNNAHLAMLSVATYTGLTKPGGGEPDEPGVYQPSKRVNFFRITPADDVQGRAAARWIRSRGGKTVYVLDDQSLYGRGLAEVFVGEAEDAGLKVLGRDETDPKAPEYRSLMARIRELSPEWIYFGGTTQTNAGQVAKDIVSEGLSARLVLPDASLDQALIDAAGPSNVNGRVFATFGGLPPEKLTGKGAAFVAHYTQRFGSAPEAYAIYGYVSAQVALDAIARVGRKDREAVRLAVAQTQQQDGALGTWHFAATGDTTLTLVSGSAARGGKFVFDTFLDVQPSGR